MPSDLNPETLAALAKWQELAKTAEDRERLSSIEKDAARMAIPAVYIDRFYISYWDGHIRLALGERATHKDGGDYWRFVALLEKDDVKTLARRLRSILRDLEGEESNEETAD